MFASWVKRSAKLLIIVALVVAFGAGVLVASPAGARVGAQEQYTMGNAEVAAVYDRVSQSVVNINVLQRVEGGTLFEFRNFPFPEGGQPPESSPNPDNGQDFYQSGQGSGFVLDTDGHIVTNYHVVQDAERIVVSFQDGTQARAEVVGTDPESDIAVIKVDVDSEVLHPVTFANSSAPYVGQPVLAIGSPFGQTWTLTTGIISALGRTIASGFTQFSIPSVIQTDAAINPGNSGGPLLDIEGNVVGVNTQILSRTGANAGVGFAVPSNLVQKVAAALIEDGSYKYAWLGISGGSLTLDQIEALKLPVNQRGVLISEVTAGGPADKAGLRGNDAVVKVNDQDVRVGGDIIVAVNGQPIRFMDELIAYLVEQTRPGDQITLTILREGAQQEVTVTLGERADAEQLAQAE